MFTFGLIPLGKVWTPLSYHLWVNGVENTRKKKNGAKSKMVRKLLSIDLFIIIVYSFKVFHISVRWCFFFTGVWVTATFLSILAVLNTAVVWMVSTWPPSSKSSSPFNNVLVTVPKAPITIGIFVTFMFLSFFNSLTRSRYLSFFSFFQFYSVVIRNSKVDNILLLLLLLLIRVFHICVSWWSFTGDWVTASLLKSPGLFSVFWPFSIMLLFGWSPLGRQLPNLPGPLIILSLPVPKSTNHNWYKLSPS